MHASWKTASSALLLLVLAGTAGCAAGGEDPARDDADLTAAEADVAPGPGGNLTVNINQNGWNDDFGGARHHAGHGGWGGHGWGGHGGHHHECGGNQPSIPATPLPAPPPPPAPPAPQPPG